MATVTAKEILFIGDCSYWSTVANAFTLTTFSNVETVFWSDGMAPRRNLSEWTGDWILSFKSDLVLPKAVIERARCGAINVHPAPPEYRGIGGYYYSAIEGDRRFGVTAHHMDERIDHGQIIMTRYFDLLPSDDEHSIREKAAVYCLTLFHDLLSLLAKGEPLPVSEEEWGERMYTKRELKEYLKQQNRIPV